MAVALSKIVPWLESKQASVGWISLVIGLVGSGAIYTSLAKLLDTVLNSNRFAKKLLFGKDDLQGTWVGCYVDRGGQNVYTVEHFEQSLDELRIKGKGFSENGEVRGEWDSIAATVDTDSKKLIYAYTCDRYHEASQFQGVCVFGLERPTSTKPPMAIHGYSADLTENAKKVENRQCRIDFEFMDMKEAFEAAKLRFANGDGE